MNLIFRIVADSLNWIGSVTGFTYNEINIIVYYIILPFVYVALVDRIFKKHFLKFIYVMAWGLLIILIPNFSAFSDALFQYSVDFLLWFGHVGLNYVAASVVICVIIPGLVFAVLCLFSFPSLRQKLFARQAADKL
jgi:hypothetical protein